MKNFLQNIKYNTWPDIRYWIYGRWEWKFIEWKFKRKYGISMGEALMWYGKHIIITETEKVE